MSWVRITDDFTSNAKIIQLTDREFRTWMRLLCHCGKTRDPSVDRIALSEVPGLTKQLVKRLAAIALLDPIGGDYEIHDWPQYQPKDWTNAERQAQWRARSNAAKTVTQSVTPAVTEPVTNGVTDAVTPLACARVPVPVPVFVEPKAVNSLSSQSLLKAMP